MQLPRVLPGAHCRAVRVLQNSDGPNFAMTQTIPYCLHPCIERVAQHRCAGVPDVTTPDCLPFATADAMSLQCGTSALASVGYACARHFLCCMNLHAGGVAFSHYHPR